MRSIPEGDPNETPTKPPEISNLCVMVCELVQECATPCKPMQGYLDFCKGFRVKGCEGGRFYEIAGLCECPSVEWSGINF